MDIPRYLAEAIHNMSGLPCEADPSPADIRGDHFIVRVENFWKEPAGITSNLQTGNMTFEQNGIPIEMYHQALPVRVIWKSVMTGENWRGRMVEQTRKNAIMFSSLFLLTVFGGKLTGAAAAMADDGVNNDIANFAANNTDGPGLRLVVELGRAPNSDKVFEPTDKRNKRNGIGGGDG